MKRVIVVHGMKRSGNHAVINWIAAHGRFVSCNNIVHIAPILRGKKQLPPPVQFWPWLRRHHPARWARYNPWFVRLDLLRRPLILNLEDHDLHFRPFLDVPGNPTNVLILREPSNLFSSRIRKGARRKNHPSYPTEEGPYMNRAVELWKRHAREFLGQTDYLGNKVCVFFDEWFADTEYRKAISARLGLDFTDEGFSSVASRGGGSSFDGTRHDGNNQLMDVLCRRSHLTDSERELLDSTLADGELQELTGKILKLG